MFRLAWGRDPWAWPDWSRAHTDGTFGNRYDDPQGLYRVLYGCTQRLGTFIETMARFRPDLHVVAGLAEIKEDDEDSGQPVVAPGELAVRDWLERRRLGHAKVGGAFCDAGDEHSLSHVRDRLAAELLALGYADFDAGTLRNADRTLTQKVSRLVFESEHEGEPFSGIRYRSRLGDNLDNWAIFEGADLAAMRTDRIRPDDPDLLEAAQLLGITLV